MLTRSQFIEYCNSIYPDLGKSSSAIWIGENSQRVWNDPDNRPGRWFIPYTSTKRVNRNIDEYMHWYRYNCHSSIYHYDLGAGLLSIRDHSLNPFLSNLPLKNGEHIKRYWLGFGYQNHVTEYVLRWC